MARFSSISEHRRAAVLASLYFLLPGLPIVLLLDREKPAEPWAALAFVGLLVIMSFALGLLIARWWALWIPLAWPVAIAPYAALAGSEELWAYVAFGGPAFVLVLWVPPHLAAVAAGVGIRRLRARRTVAREFMRLPELPQLR